MREDDLEEIAKNIKGNLKEDAKSSASREEDIPQEEEDTYVYLLVSTYWKSMITKYEVFQWV